MDFFRPSLCLSSHMTSLQATFLEYTIGLYPLLMIAVIYVIVQLYDRCCTTMRHNCRLCCCVSLLRRFEIQSALIDAFATFFILAYVKIGYTSVSILEPTAVYTPAHQTEHIDCMHMPMLQWSTWEQSIERTLFQQFSLP